MNAALQFCLNAEAHLSTAEPKTWAEEYVRLVMQFYREYCKGYLFPSRFGADIFKEVARHIQTGEMLPIPAGETELGEYDDNFNRWVKLQRKTL